MYTNPKVDRTSHNPSGWTQSFVHSLWHARAAFSNDPDLPKPSNVSLHSIVPGVAKRPRLPKGGLRGGGAIRLPPPPTRMTVSPTHPLIVTQCLAPIPPPSVTPSSSQGCHDRAHPGAQLHHAPHTQPCRRRAHVIGRVPQRGVRQKVRRRLKRHLEQRRHG